MRLKTSYVDLYQLHWPDRYTPLWGNVQYNKSLEGKHEQQPRADGELPIPFDEIVVCMGELIAAGLIRHWGVSNESSFGICTWVEACRRLGVPCPVSVQNDFSLCDRRFEGELAETCSSMNHNLGLLAYGALNGGTLSGKYIDGAKPSGARHVAFPGFQGRYLAPRSLRASEKYAALARAHGLTPAELALAWAFSRHYMASVIIGATSMEQLLENCGASDIVLSKEVLAAIGAIHLECRNPNAKN